MPDSLDSVSLTPREAASGILGSISLACWMFLSVPQLIENYKCGSAEALSLSFLAIWFVGDAANLIGALWAHLVPVVIAIGVYFCISDSVLISQTVYYNVKNAREDAAAKYGQSQGSRGGDGDHDDEDNVPDPTTPLLSRGITENGGYSAGGGDESAHAALLRRRSSHRSHRQVEDSLAKILDETEPRKAWIKNTLSVLAICAIGTAGWAIAWQTGAWKPTPEKASGDAADISIGAQVVGYFSAVCYLGARIPQIVKNYRDKSCEGLALLFFVLSLLGNLTYGAGILMHSTEHEYVLTNIPWLIGSLGTMLEDITIFAQFRIYALKEEANGSAVA